MSLLRYLGLRELYYQIYFQTNCSSLNSLLFPLIPSVSVVCQFLKAIVQNFFFIIKFLPLPQGLFIVQGIFWLYIRRAVLL